MKDGASDMRSSITRRPTQAPVHVKFDSSWPEHIFARLVNDIAPLVVCSVGNLNVCIV